MVKYGRQFESGLAGLSSTSGWAHVDYAYYKQSLKAMLSSTLPPLPITADFAGEGPEAEAVRSLDATFRRSLLSDIAGCDACFGEQCAKLRERMEAAHFLREAYEKGFAAHEDEDAAIRACREQLLELHRWSALNYLAVLKIVKKHDKSGLLTPLRTAIIAALSACAFVRALEWSEGWSEAATAQTTGEEGDGATSPVKPRIFSRHDATPSPPPPPPPPPPQPPPGSPRDNPYGSLLALLPEGSEVELQAILREVASDKYRPRDQLRVPAPPPPPPPPMASAARTRLLLLFGLTCTPIIGLEPRTSQQHLAAHAFG